MAKKQFLYENVYNDLKQKIECGDLKPGDKLAVEEDMIAHYGVGAILIKSTESLAKNTGFAGSEEKAVLSWNTRKLAGLRWKKKRYYRKNRRVFRQGNCLPGDF